jgi:hypothetical protein
VAKIKKGAATRIAFMRSTVTAPSSFRIQVVERALPLILPTKPARLCNYNLFHHNPSTFKPFTFFPVPGSKSCFYPCSRLKTDWELALAWAMANELACTRICILEKVAASSAKSTSRIEDSAAVTLTLVADRLEMVEVNWF